jgi:glyceraldehyde 3-phosphate dehydrogenase
LRVPSLNVNLVDLGAVLKVETTAEEIRKAFVDASLGDLKGIVGIADENLVSRDFSGRQESVVMDLGLTKVIGGRMVKVFGWHDNEVAYAVRLCELVEIIAARL